MTGGPHYPEDVIIGILFDHLDHPGLAPYTHYVWDKAVEARAASARICTDSVGWAEGRNPTIPWITVGALPR